MFSLLEVWGGELKKISVVGCTDWVLPTCFDLMSRRLSIASPYSSETRQPSARVCQRDQKSTATVLVRRYSVLIHFSEGMIFIIETVLIPMHSFAVVVECRERPF